MILKHLSRLGSGNVHALAGTEYGKMLAAGVLDRIDLYARQGGELLTSLEQAHPHCITDLCLPTSALLFSSSVDGTVKAWKLKLGEGTQVMEKDLQTHVHALISLSPGSFLCATEAGLMRVEDWKILWLDESVEGLRSLSLLPEGTAVVGGGHDCTLSLWEFDRDSYSRRTLLHHYSVIQEVKSSPDGKQASFLSEEQRIHFVDLDSGRVSSVATSDMQPTCHLWSLDGQHIHLGGQNGQLYGLSLSDQSFQSRDFSFSHPVSCLVRLGKDALACASWDGRIVWTTGDGAQLGSPRACQTKNLAYVLSADFSPDGKSLVSGHSDGTVRIWSAKDGELQEKWNEHEEPVYSVRFAPNGTYLASGSVDTTIKVWDFEEGVVALDLQDLHEDPVHSVAVSRDSKFLATGSGDTYTAVYSIAEVKAAAKAKFDDQEYWHFAVKRRILNSVQWSPKNDRFVVGVSDGSAVVLFFDGKKVEKGPVLKGHTEPVSCVDWSKDGGLIAAGSYDRCISLWNGSTYRRLEEPFRAHDEPIQCLAFSPCGRYIASGSWDGTLKIWDVQTRKELICQTRPHFSAVETVAWNSQGERLLSGSSDGTLLLWRFEGRKG